MFSRISNYFHILKARVLVAYILSYCFGACSGIHFRNLYKQLVKNTLFVMRHPFAYFKDGVPEKIQFGHIHASIKNAYNVLYGDFFKRYAAHRKTSSADYVYVAIELPKCAALGTYFTRIIGTAWLCEKLGLNVKFTFPDNTNFFENSFLSYAKTCHPEGFTQLRKSFTDLNHRKNGYWHGPIGVASDPPEEFAKRRLSSEYGHKIISALSIKHEIQQQADQWCNANIKGECVGVHYRQTDAIGEDRIINIDSYIDYLKQVLDDRCQILTCSDTAQFIDEIYKAFPGRIISRDIVRSHDLRPIHRHGFFAPKQQYLQMTDALMDMLILAKTKTIYTVGSYFIDAIRFLNPSIKIVSLDQRNEVAFKYIPNFIPVPKKDIAIKARSDRAWKGSLLNTKSR